MHARPATTLCPSPPGPAWAELVSLVNDIRSPALEDVLAAIREVCGDRLAPALAARIADSVHRLYRDGPSRD